jgi:phosphoribosyl 1,2-cyclic phosphodiesterase
LYITFEVNMIVKLWGVRGSVPTPVNNEEYRGKLRRILHRAVQSRLSRDADIGAFIDSLPPDLGYFYGGNTTCVSVTSETGSVYVLDCGTGMRPLGEKLLEGAFGRGEGLVRIFITHTHWDHIQGLPFFKPIYIPGNKLEFYAPYESLEYRLIQQMEHRYFPVDLHKTASTKSFHQIHPGLPVSMEDNLQVDCHPLKHPGGSYAYRFREGDKSFVFCTDTEFTGEILEKQEDETDFFRDADLMVIDSQYTLDESFLKFAWGHTSYTVAVNCAVRWRVKNLVLTHHEPSYSDEQLLSIHQQAILHRNQMRTSSPKIHMAREGTAFRL